MVLKNNGSFSFRRVNFLFLKEAILSDSFWNTLALVVFVCFLFFFSKIFKRNLNLSTSTCDRLVKSLNPRNVFGVLGLDAKKDYGTHKFYLNLSKRKLVEFFSWIFKQLWVFISFSWLIVLFVKLQKLFQTIVWNIEIHLFKCARENNYSICLLRKGG
ncbi:hypothetical protein A6V39_01505 [Candidatus Mycoplasma haematobovis]|uniref:Uncharacterized protein n=1 Tax=Candidatus Mycoplasma haematobovis TaxID=432608 RepID=A0A1A9QDP1_9MOLU|nr:hypothetical protein [Candidatus Mycoplasma haematobovis]OAL10722.1 hypothetical protein A6V39_01505 [Candidatus Mycoplasma haematobovis]